MKNYDLARIDYIDGYSTQEIAKKYNVSVNTVRSWKKRFNWGDVKKEVKRCKNVAKRKKQEVARVLITEGGTIRETARKVGLPRSTVWNLSKGENLQEKQLEYLKAFRDEQRERVRQNKLKRLALNEEIIDVIIEEVTKFKKKGKVDKGVLEKLLMSEELEQKIFELDRIERLEKIEIEKRRTSTEENGVENKVDEYFNILQGGIEDEGED